MRSSCTVPSRSSAPYQSAICATSTPVAIQNALMCGMLSSSSRATACTRSVSLAVGRRQLAHLVVVGMERQRNERLEAAGLVLQRARPQHVIDALGMRLDVPVEHRHVRCAGRAGAPGGESRGSARHRPCRAQIFRRTRSAKISAPPPGQRVEARRHQLRAARLLVGHAVGVGEERNLDGREALQVDARADRLQAAEQVEVVVERQVGMQAVDDVDLGERLRVAAAQLVEDLLERQRVGLRIAGPQPRERTEQATRHADVRGLEPEVEVVVGAARRAAARARGWRASRRRAGPGSRTARTPSSAPSRSPASSLSAMSARPRARRRERTVAFAPPRRSHDHDAQRARARPVEFGHEHALPLPEHDLPAADLQRQAVTEQHRPQVGVGVVPVAVGVIADRCAATRRRARRPPRGTA